MRQFISFRNLLSFVMVLGCVVFVTKQSFAEPKLATSFYSASRGKIKTVGQIFTMNFSDKVVISTDFESYINQFAGDSFQPDMINFGLGVQLGNVGWYHQCLHDIDQYINKYYPKKNKFYVLW